MSIGPDRIAKPEYWDIIRVDGANFLTLASRYESGLYSGELKPSVLSDLVRGARGVVGGTLRLLASFVRSSLRSPSRRLSENGEYAVLVGAGGAKYAKEEREMREACERKGLRVVTVYAYPRPAQDGGEEYTVLSPEADLRPGDHVRILLSWLWSILRHAPRYLSREAKRRSLLVATISANRMHMTYGALVKRVIKEQGPPAFLFTLAPWTAVSTAMVDQIKKEGVPTAALRTQTTYAEPEHLVFDSVDVLFCKSLMERDVYQAVFDGASPRLEEGCLLSTPEEYVLPPLALPEDYVLLLGTDPPASQAAEEHERYHARLRAVASASGLPAVFKEHHLTSGHSVDAAGSWTDGEGAVHLADTRRNKGLIDGAKLVVSAPSTLLYYAILCEKPVVIVESFPFEWLPDEFASAPITRISWDSPAAVSGLDWDHIRGSGNEVKAWFEGRYFLSRGADSMVGIMMQEERGSHARTGAQSQRTAAGSTR